MIEPGTPGNGTRRPHSIFILAGESSGDLHGGHLASALKKLRPDLTLFGLGGRSMKEAGVEILADPTQVAVIGIVEVLRHLSTFRALFHQAVRALDERRPDLVVLIDYPGFNLHFAKEVKRRGIRLVYYISPQIWAWDPGRIRKIKRLVDRMLVVFPFEKSLYEKAGIPVTFVGHPLLELVKPTLPRLEALGRFGLEDAMPIIGLLPGSRRMEVKRILPVMLAAGEKMQEALPSSARFLLIKAPHLPWELYKEALAHSSLNPKVVERWDYDGIYSCDLVFVASGTATLECALLDRPMLILYKTSWPTYLISRLLIRIPMIGLVNVVASFSNMSSSPSSIHQRAGEDKLQRGSLIVPEFIQRQATAENIAQAGLEIWSSAARRETMRLAFRTLRESLGEPGASRRAAGIILKELAETKRLQESR